MAADRFSGGVHRHQSLFRDGLGFGLDRYRRGLLIAGALAAWVPNEFWQSFLLVDHARLAEIWGPLVGLLVALISFVYSVGHAWQGNYPVERQSVVYRGFFARERYV